MQFVIDKSKPEASEPNKPGCEESMAPWLGDLGAAPSKSFADSSQPITTSRRRRTVGALRKSLMGRGKDCRSSWPRLLAQRVEIVSMTTSPERTAEDEPVYIDYGFEVLLNDPGRTRLILPVRVTAEDAAAPGYFDDADRLTLSPDYQWKAWYAICRFARALSEMVNSQDDGSPNTSRSRWAVDTQTW